MNTTEGRKRLDDIFNKSCKKVLEEAIHAINKTPLDTINANNTYMLELLIKYKKLVKVAIGAVSVYKTKSYLGISHSFVLTNNDLQKMFNETNLDSITINTEKIRQSFGIII